LNPRQRRGALLLIVSVIGAISVVAAVASYISDVQSQVGPMRTVLQLTDDLDRFEPITAGHLTETEVPARWAPDTALDPTTAQLRAKVAAADLPAGTVLQEGSLLDPPTIEPTEREFAILVSPETGVGGKIQAGDVVDVYATYGSIGERPPRAELVLQAVRIIDIAPAVERSDPDAGFATNTAVPVTFALSADEALVLAYAESFATEVRLGLRSAVDTEEVPEDRRRFELEDTTS
jgi:pilus assembly protein CpaB